MTGYRFADQLRATFFPECYVRGCMLILYEEAEGWYYAHTDVDGYEEKSTQGCLHGGAHHLPNLEEMHTLRLLTRELHRCREIARLGVY